MPGRVWTAAIVSAGVVVTAGCTVGPNYKRPSVAVPQSFRSAPADTPADPSLAQERWPEVFRDPALQRLVQEALANNLDLGIAAQRIVEAQAHLGIIRADQLPSVGGGAGYSGIQVPQSFAGTNSGASPGKSILNGGGFSASAAWNLDFWGMYRRQTEAARAELLASEWGQRAVRLTLMQNVAQAYFELRDFDEQLQITQSTIDTRKDSVRLTELLEKHGASSLADVRQAEELLDGAQANVPELRRQIASDENALSVLLGRNPGTIERGLPVAEQPHPDAVPVGVPSQLLERRPDIQQAEAKLMAANARIGVARAQFLPQISLTGLGGSASSQLTTLFAGQNAYWYVSGSLTQPIFEGGRIRNNYRLSDAQRDEMVLEYRKAILNALQDVSNTLVAYRETRNAREEQFAQVTAAADAARLARLRYSGGNASYLEVLVTDTDLYAAQLLLVQAQQREALSLIQLYGALGGGW
jgi:multidrug efflux system outer membrane protein